MTYRIYCKDGNNYLAHTASFSDLITHIAVNGYHFPDCYVTMDDVKTIERVSVKESIQDFFAHQGLLHWKNYFKFLVSSIPEDLRTEDLKYYSFVLIANSNPEKDLLERALRVVLLLPEPLLKSFYLQYVR